MIIKIINNIDLYMIFILCDGLNGYLLLGLSKLEIDVKFLGLEEKSITSCPPLERFFMTLAQFDVICKNPPTPHQ